MSATAGRCSRLLTLSPFHAPHQHIAQQHEQLRRRDQDEEKRWHHQHRDCNFGEHGGTVETGIDFRTGRCDPGVRRTARRGSRTVQRPSLSPPESARQSHREPGQLTLLVRRQRIKGGDHRWQFEYATIIASSSTSATMAGARYNERCSQSSRRTDQ